MTEPTDKFASAAAPDAAGLTWWTVCRSDELIDGQAREVIAGRWVIAVFRVGDRLYAVDGMCAHQGGPIAKGKVSVDAQNRACVTCPWHGWQYELDSGIQTINRQPLLATFATRQIDDLIQVATE